MAFLVSMGGFVFGYDTGTISGILNMDDFLRRFGQPDPHTSKYYFTNVRKGLIVGLLSIGCLVGALVAAPIADRIGRKFTITFWSLIYCVSLIVQISATEKWYQVAIGRLVGGSGIGALSVLVPMYMSETSPRQIRGALVCAFQLFITFGILIGNLVVFGTHKKQNANCWRIPIGIGFVWPALLGGGIVFLPDSPRFAYRAGKTEIARKTMSRFYGVPENHEIIHLEIEEMREKLEAETVVGEHPWYEIFTGPRMAYRTLLGVALQALQQLTGANFFFYYGNTVFQATGLSDSYETQIILGVVNFAMTFVGLWVVETFGRRKCLIYGALWMFVCFMIFASVGHYSLDQNNPTMTPKAGAAMICFACFFICGFATTWGCIVWGVVGELYPSRYRALCMGLATCGNWIFVFLIGFFTPFITEAIEYRYGYIFAACCFAAAFVVYFFVCESKGRSLEEIDTMYIMRVRPWQSENWTPPVNEDLKKIYKFY
ncbi:putative MFS monosaccharide transporter [Xylona heveae TC161]|uniref:Putative MFS monosaccharide transporter n=1 Tax=Xylona heveae (strain CBS 132557 / TC161) TaxID=1328760 RepID=A0A161TP44_XYLHT|nr:putative MFS monosaccharide transporter [Xylona heveae TC161]KZF23876.1 putative MFS monosaccharide transporter [Xylona heveae TC161]